MALNKISKVMLEDDVKTRIDKIDGIESSLAEKAKQADLEATNTNVALKANKTDLETQKNRIDNLVTLPEGSTTNDARLEDIKIGADGVTYTSPAEAVRQQLTKINDGFKENVLKIKNEILNGNFENGQASWDGTFGTNRFIENAGGYNGEKWLKVTTLGSGTVSTFQNINCNIGDVIYFRVWNTQSVVAGGGGLGSSVRLRQLEKTEDLATLSLNTVSGSWRDMSIVAQATENVIQCYLTAFGSGYVGGFDGAVAVNLTKTFGKGNEPNKGEIDLLLEQFPQKWFVGEANITQKQLTLWQIRKERIKMVINLHLESDGINKTDGKIMKTGLVSDNRYGLIKRTGKYLKVLPSSKIKTTFNEGLGFVFQYDSKFNFISHTALTSDNLFELSPLTKMIKFSFENINTKGFMPTLSYDTTEEKPTWVYNNKAINSGVSNISFIYETNTNQGRNILTNNSTEKQYTTERYFNSGILKLPPNYDPHGEPVRLIFIGQGSSDYNGFASASIGTAYEKHYEYMLDEGYAIFGCHRWTTKYPAVERPNIGSPTSYAAIVDAYNWIIKNFNIRQDGVLAAGKSSGVTHVLGLSYNKGLPLLAVGGLAGGTSLFIKNAFFGETYDTRLAIADDFGFEGDHTILQDISVRTLEHRNYLKLNARKMIGYNNHWNGLISADFDALVELALDNKDRDYAEFSNLSRICHVPTKLWVAEDDPIDLYPENVIYTKTIENGGGICELRTMPNGTGGHASVDNDPNALKVSSITTKLGYVHENVPLAYVELIQWFRRFGG
jgi:hypothetical protein